ncbi:MAG: hypothetical protein SFW66_06680 [Gammaproteobacteria bacterium]|nr:hypothetical protein [Gammaproteobacteria bacterium]
MKYLIPLLCATILFSPYAFAKDKHASYFKSLQALEKLPKGATPVQPVSDTIKNQISHLLNLQNTGTTIYRGDFNQDGITEYAVITTSGSIGAQTVNMYRFEGGLLFNEHFDQAVTQSLFPKKDMSKFYLFVAKPFAFTLKGKTYLRFLNASSNYDKYALRVCTYQWHQNNTFSLSGPNLKFDQTNDQIVPADDCLTKHA